MTVADQISIFDALRAPMIRRRVDPHGPVLQGKPAETLSMDDGKTTCRIELHPAPDGLWMWSTGYSLANGSGTGYKVGEKWGHFAETRDDALHYAIAELRERLADHVDRKAAQPALAWLDSLEL